MYELASVISAVPLPGFHARVTFGNGDEREIDLWPYVNHGGIFEAIRSDQAFFEQMTIENDTISWPNGADIDPDVLYLGLPPNATEEQWREAVAARQSAGQRAA
jgi:hypothetical protein